MKKILIILTFLFVSIFTYSESAFSYSKSVNIDFDIRVMMGLTKIEEKDNPKYKKFLNYIDENLVKKGEVKYSHKVNMDKKVVEFFSEKGEFLLAENLPKEFLDIVDRSIRVAENKEEIKKTIKNIYEDPYTYVSISKYKENLILFTEQNMVNRGKIKNTMSVVLKRELTDNEKNELIYLKNNDNDEFFNKYRTYIDIETTKTYINDKLELFQEIKGLTDTIILYRKNEVSKEVLEYTDSSRLNSVAKGYRNDRLLKETFVKNKEIVLEKEYYANGKLAREIPLKDGLINGEAKDYYENGKIRSTATFVNGDIDGVVKEYNQAGKVVKETLYKNGKKVK
ncbi:toxin-antitoxin system YwqK family antitoxin [Fusobacterium nucleatum]|nr:toxin-antitoxin system YwqK family antitoxin [Fusobacterium nucleatum]BEP08938.1 toxin-antitoxin system YwqK family antitoxin [Fusobacterium nucleatum]